MKIICSFSDFTVGSLTVSASLLSSLSLVGIAIDSFLSFNLIPPVYEYLRQLYLNWNVYTVINSLYHAKDRIYFGGRLKTKSRH